MREQLLVFLLLFTSLSLAQTKISGEVFDEFGESCISLDQVIAITLGMRRGKTYTLDSVNLVHGLNELHKGALAIHHVNFSLAVAVDDLAKEGDLFYPALIEAGFKCYKPEGAYYVLADFSDLSDLPDDEFSFWLTSEIGVAPVPGSSFYSDPQDGRHLARFAFCKTEDLLEQAAERLITIRSRI